MMTRIGQDGDGGTTVLVPKDEFSVPLSLTHIIDRSAFSGATAVSQNASHLTVTPLSSRRLQFLDAERSVTTILSRHRVPVRGAQVRHMS
jgi:hypothetical protein